MSMQLRYQWLQWLRFRLYVIKRRSKGTESTDCRQLRWRWNICNPAGQIFWSRSNRSMQFKKYSANIISWCGLCYWLHKREIHNKRRDTISSWNQWKLSFNSLQKSPGIKWNIRHGWWFFITNFKSLVFGRILSFGSKKMKSLAAKTTKLIWSCWQNF